MADGARPAYSERVAQLFVDAIEKGTAKWMKPWEPGMGAGPYNPLTGNRYRGINNLYLDAMGDVMGSGDPRWLTYKQAGELGAQVKRGAVGVTVEYWQWTKDEQNPETKQKETKKLDRPKVFWATVFNASQISGLPELVTPEQGWEPNARAQDLITESKAFIEHRNGDRAFYSVGGDKIVMPEMAQFKALEHYYATLLHELTHWTAHPDRCNREIGKAGFGTEPYSKEELIAELGSFMLCRELGLSRPGQDEQHQAYVASWLKVLKDDPREIFRAAAQAEKAMAYVMQYDLAKVHNETLKESRKLEPKALAQEPTQERSRERHRQRTREPAQAGASR